MMIAIQDVARKLTCLLQLDVTPHLSTCSVVDHLYVKTTGKPVYLASSAPMPPVAADRSRLQHSRKHGWVYVCQ